MNYYNVRIKERAKKEIRGLPKKDIARIIDKIKHLAKLPRPTDCVKLGKDEFRVRQGNYRILYSIDDAEKKVIIFKVRHRREAYRRE
ncbi:MAG: type II toxin-antitoxin system RelE/ParE family toxin [Candidatus Omnitrophota bacterium]